MKDGKDNIKLQLTDDQISTESMLPRRSFLAKTGAMLLGAVAVVAATRAGALTGQQSDPDKAKATDPDAKKGAAKKKTAMKAKAADPDQTDAKKKTAMRKKKTGAKASDPDKPKQPQ